MIALDLAPVWLSIRVASAATLVDVAIGLPVAWLLARRSFRGKAILSGFLTLPLVLPPTVLGYGLLLLLGRRGWVGRWLDATLGVSVVFHWSGAVVAASVAAFPLFLIPARASLAGVDGSLEDVARLLGRGEWSVVRSVTLPLCWRGLASGAVLSFARALGDFGTTLMVAGDIPGRTRTASLAIYDAVQANQAGQAAGYAILVALASMAALGLAHRASPSPSPSPTRPARAGDRP